jgi:hypothetical protein
MPGKRSVNEPPIIIGVESEYAIAPRIPGEYGPVDSEPSLGGPQTVRSTGLIAQLKSRYPYLCGMRNGLFLGNAARVYVDRGHPEYATPEAPNPLEAAAHVLAGRRLLKEALDTVDLDTLDPARGSRLALFDVNLDYAERGCATWACHENYAFRGPANVVRRAILPHLCSRVILTGAGGFNPNRPLAFVISPRGLMVPGAVERMQEDALFHVRQESYAGGDIDRLHIIAGESLRSHRGIFLKLGTTALLVWLAQRGYEIGPAYRPKSVLMALQTFSEDLSGFTRVCCVNGEWRSALEIQHALLEMAQDAIRTDAPGDWAGPLVNLWRESLNRFALQGQMGIQQTFDWAIKWAVFDAHCRRFGMPFQRLLEWGEVLAKLARASKQFGACMSQPKRAFEIVITELRNSWLEFGSRPLHELELVLRLRLQLRELDWRFCQVGDGVFDELNRQKVLRHDVPGLTPQMISDAMKVAPRQTRAWVRSDIINRWHGSALAKNARCDWRRVTDPDHNRVLELDDPTSVVEHWRKLNSSDELYSDPFDRAIELHRASQFHEADLSLRRLRRSVNWRNTDSTRVDTYPFRVLRYSAWVQSRLGRLDAIEFLDRIYGSQASPEAQCCKIGDYLYCYRFLGLVPHPMFEGLIEPAMQFLTTPAPSDEPMQAHVREHLGAYALSRGWLDAVDASIGDARNSTTLWRRVRVHCILADMCRRKGWLLRAREFLASARQSLADGDVLAAEQIVPIQAKLEPDTQRRAILLDAAARRLLEARHYMALARVILLRARNCGGGEIARTLRKQFSRCRRATDVLASCPLAARIAMNWPAWTESFEPDESGDAFWGV